MKKRIFAAAGLAMIVVLAMAGMAYATLSGLSDSEIEARVKDLVSKMTLDEKIEQMHGSAKPANIIRGSFMSGIWDTAENKRLGIPALKCIDGPRGVGMKGATAFPVGMSRGASWNPELEKRIGEAMGYETRAMGANILLAPCINILRHPSWGRAQESYGEDPLVLGTLGSAFVVGTQKHVMACSKHYIANNIEGSRFSVNAVIDERTMREVYLPHFKMTVDAGVASVMSSYNDVNGFLAGQNQHIITDILKNEMGFKGFVISDWQNATDNTLLAANAGMDIEMPTGAHLGAPLKKAVELPLAKLGKHPGLLAHLLETAHRALEGFVLLHHHARHPITPPLRPLWRCVHSAAIGITPYKQRVIIRNPS